MEHIRREVQPYWWTREDPQSMPSHSSRPTAPPPAAADHPPLPLPLHLHLRPRPPIQRSTRLADLEHCPRTGPARHPLARDTSRWLRVPVRSHLQFRGNRDWRLTPEFRSSTINMRRLSLWLILPRLVPRVCAFV